RGGGGGGRGMARMSASGGRPQEFAYFISLPLALLTIALLVPLAVQVPPTIREIPVFGLYLLLFAIGQATYVHFEVRRHSFMLSAAEIALLVALFYLSPVMVVTARVVALVAVLARQPAPFGQPPYNPTPPPFPPPLAPPTA